jgi:hypothetical protein
LPKTNLAGIKNSAMKTILLFLSLILVISCTKSKDMISPEPPVINNPQPAPALSSFVSMNLNGETINFTSVVKERSRGLKYLNFLASNDSLKIELKTSSINQTGNSTGLILVVLYQWKFYKKNPENSYQSYPVIEQWLGLYSDNPLTDSIVVGNFYFKTNIPGSTAINSISNGSFRLVF